MGTHTHSNRGDSASASSSGSGVSSEESETESTTVTTADDRSSIEEAPGEDSTHSKHSRSTVKRKEEMDRDFVLIHRATPLDQFGNLDDPFSVESQVARARGNGWLPFADRSMRRGQESLTDEDVRNVVRFDQGTINAQTGYVMEFVDPELHELSVFDIVSIPGLKSWPVPESALASLPEDVRGTLFQQGFVKLQGRYVKDEQAFQDVRRGWTVTPENKLDLLMQVIEALDGSLALAVSVVVTEHGSNRWSDPSSIADARGIEADTVRKQIKEARESVPDPLLDGL